MEPKFQSSFIPKTPAAAAGVIPATKQKEKNFLGFLALAILIISLALAVGVFGYKLFLERQITQMGQDLEAARAALEPEVINEFIRLDNRIVSAGQLISGHVVLSPLFDLLEESTLQSVRFTEFSYGAGETGPEVSMRGQARGYAALAQQADIFNDSQGFGNPVFSDLSLDESGNVTFIFKASIDWRMLSYERQLENLPASFVQPVLPAEQPVPAATTAAAATSTSGATTTEPINQNEE